MNNPDMYMGRCLRWEPQNWDCEKSPIVPQPTVPRFPIPARCFLCPPHGQVQPRQLHQLPAPPPAAPSGSRPQMRGPCYSREAKAASSPGQAPAESSEDAPKDGTKGGTPKERTKHGPMGQRQRSTQGTIRKDAPKGPLRKMHPKDDTKRYP